MKREFFPLVSLPNKMGPKLVSLSNNTPEKRPKLVSLSNKFEPFLRVTLLGYLTELITVAMPGR